MAPPPDPNGDWFYDKHTGQISHITNFFEKMYFEARTDIYVSFKTEADAKAFKVEYEAAKQGKETNPEKTWWLNPSDGTIFHGSAGEMSSPWIAFGTEAEAKAYLKTHPATDPLNKAIQGVTGAVNSMSSIPASVGGFFKALTQGATWLRVGEGALGLILISIGIAVVAKGTPAAKSVGKVAKYIK